jgi:ketosteroid isomerase-like protein
MSSTTARPGQPGTSVEVNPDHALAEARLNTRTVQSLFDAVDCRDRAGVVAAYDEDIVIHEPASLPYGGDHHGHEGALRHGMGFRAAWDRFQPHDKRGLEPQIIADGDHVAVRWRHRAENAETGDKIDLPAVSIYRMRNGKVVDSRMFHFDTAALVQFLEDNTNAEAE